MLKLIITLLINFILNFILSLMAASGGTWHKGKFIPPHHTMAIVANQNKQPINPEAKQATIITALDDVRNNLGDLKRDDLISLRDQLNTLLDDAPATNQKIKQQKTTPTHKGQIITAYGPDPRVKYNVQYEVIEADALIASNTPTGAINPNYPQELQPRDRTRTASKQQIERIAKSLNPDALLTEFRSLDRGTPIIGKDDNVVESGNGRTLALNLARQQFPEQYQTYKTQLKEQASTFGIDPKHVDKLNNPVLVRRRVENVNRIQFAQAANSATILGTSETERAKSDAQRITTGDINRLDLGEDTDKDLRATKNRDFIRAFVGQLPQNEQATIIDRKGDLTQSGLLRVKAALFTRVYEDTNLSDRIFESTDNDMKNITNGMMASLGRVGQAEEKVRSGQRNQDLTIKEDVTKAVGVFASLKQRGITTQEYLAQGQLLGRELTPTQEKILTAIDQRRRSGKQIKELFNQWADLVDAEPHPQQTGFFSNSSRTKEQLITDWLNQKHPKHQARFF